MWALRGKRREMGLDAVDGSSTWRASAIGSVADEVTTIRRS